MFERIDTICLTVSDVEKSSIWYEGLGFKVSFVGEDYRILSIGKSQIPLTIEEGHMSGNRTSRAYPIFFTKDIKRTYRKLKEKGVEITDLQDDGDNVFFDFYDLDHNRLQVCYWE